MLEFVAKKTHRWLMPKTIPVRLYDGFGISSRGRRLLESIRTAGMT
jgi:hypothetical protein